MNQIHSDAAAPFEELYDRAVQELLDVAVTDTWVETGVGQTHVLTAGDPTAPPIIVFQGGNVTNPVTLAWFQGLADEYSLVAPDTPGQPGKRVLAEPADFGSWAVDVLDGLGIERAPMIGVSHGGGVLLEVAAHASDRIAAAALVAPAGLGTPPSLALARVIVPSLVYRLVPHRTLLERALGAMFSDPVETIDEVVIETIGKALRTTDLRAEFPGPEDPSNLSEFHVPTLVILSQHDPFFPAKRIRPRAEQVLPSLVDCVILKTERHFLSDTGQTRATESIRSFLANGSGDSVDE